MTEVTAEHLQLLQDLSVGDAVVLAAFREGSDIARDDRYFPGGRSAGSPRIWVEGEMRRVSPKTMQTAYLAGHVAHAEGDTGDRVFDY